ncbi:hypothetical protein HJ01_01954 [Flavobacterium frigoris PS1]|uniref:Uncharacterized protein n=1 Tax=Flavobacterium frigoris (strain PS1) TaxID=1086011 RepID=H7FRU2_FLAFP|nr:hypothetical protein HJ01_01954 [Flavobacterium frigoris PS1]
MKKQSIPFILFTRSNKKINLYRKPFFGKIKERFFYANILKQK